MQTKAPTDTPPMGASSYKLRGCENDADGSRTFLDGSRTFLDGSRTFLDVKKTSNINVFHSLERIERTE